MSGTTVFVVAIVVVFLGAMIGMLVYMDSGKDSDAVKEQKPKP